MDTQTVQQEVIVPQISLFEYVAERICIILNYDIELCRLYLVQLFYIPLAILFFYLNGPKKRQILSTILGIVGEYLVYGFYGSVFQIAIVLVNYFLILKLKQRKGFIVLIMNILYILFHSIYEPLNTEIVNGLMVKCANCTAFAFSLEDGTKKKEELTNDQEKFRVNKMKNLWEFFGYNYFFPIVLVGPYVDYRDYEDLIYKKGDFQKLSFKNQLKNAIFQAIQSILGLLLAQTLLKKMDIWYTITEDYGKKPLYYKIGYYMLMSVDLRVYFYFLWGLQNCVLALTGITYNGSQYNEKKQKIIEKYDRIQQVDILKMELSVDFNTKIRFWNIRTHLWLKRYCYQRIFSLDGMRGSVFKRNLASFLSFQMLSLWHGYNFGFIVGYVMCFFLSNVLKLGRRVWGKLFLKDNNKKIKRQSGVMEGAKWVFFGVFLNFYLDFQSSCFQLYGVERVVRFNGQFGYFHFVSLSIIYVFLAGLNRVVDIIGIKKNKEKEM